MTVQAQLNSYNEKQLSKANRVIQEELDMLSYEIPYKIFSNQFFKKLLQAKYPKYVENLWTTFVEDLYVGDETFDKLFNINLLELNSSSPETEVPAMFFEMALDFADWNWDSINPDGPDTDPREYTPYSE